jgi:hypothetical protein
LADWYGKFVHFGGQGTARSAREVSGFRCAYDGALGSDDNTQRGGAIASDSGALQVSGTNFTSCTCWSGSAMKIFDQGEMIAQFLVVAVCSGATAIDISIENTLTEDAIFYGNNCSTGTLYSRARNTTVKRCTFFDNSRATFVCRGEGDYSYVITGCTFDEPEQTLQQAYSCSANAWNTVVFAEPTVAGDVSPICVAQNHTDSFAPSEELSPSSLRVPSAVFLDSEGGIPVSAHFPFCAHFESGSFDTTSKLTLSKIVESGSMADSTAIFPSASLNVSERVFPSALLKSSATGMQTEQYLFSPVFQLSVIVLPTVDIDVSSHLLPSALFPLSLIRLTHTIAQTSFFELSAAVCAESSRFFTSQKFTVMQRQTQSHAVELDGKVTASGNWFIWVIVGVVVALAIVVGVIVFLVRSRKQMSKPPPAPEPTKIVTFDDTIGPDEPECENPLDDENALSNESMTISDGLNHSEPLIY